MYAMTHPIVVLCLCLLARVSLTESSPLRDFLSSKGSRNLQESSSTCAQDVAANYARAKTFAESIISTNGLDTADQATLDCFLTRYRAIIYTGLPVLTMWRMQLGTRDMMSQVFAQRRETLAENNFNALLSIQDNDAVWSYLYSRYYPHDVQGRLWESDVEETARMVVMVKRESCIDELIGAYQEWNRQKYLLMVQNPSASYRVQTTNTAGCNPQTSMASTQVMVLINRASGSCLDHETWTDNVHLKSCRSEDDQIWYMDGDLLKTYNSNDKCLAVGWFGNVGMATCNAGDAQQRWYFEANKIKSTDGSRCLDRNSWTSNVFVTSCNDSSSQLWTMSSFVFLA